MDKPSILDICIVIFCSVCWAAMLSLMIPLLPVLVFIYAVKLLEEYVYEKLYDATVMTSEESLWRRDGPKNWGIINAVIMLHGTADINKLQLVIQARLVDAKKQDGHTQYPKATMYPQSGYINRYWIPVENFDINNYVYEYTDTVPHTRSELENVISELLTKPMKEQQACWEVIVVPYVDESGPYTTLFFRGHHSMADGMSLAYFLTNQMPDNPPKLPEAVRKFSEKDRLLLELKGLFYVPLFALKMFVTRTDRSVFHVPDVEGRKSMAWSKPTDLNLIKDIKNNLGLTVNDVLLGCISHCFQDYSAESQAEAKGKKQVQAPVSDLLTFFPVDVRADALSACEFKNEFGIPYFHLPIGLSDPKETILDTKRRLDDMKISGLPFAVRWTTVVLQFWLPEFASGLIFWNLARKASMVVSCVPGPQQEVSVAGHKMKFLTFSPPQRYNVGTSCSIFTYAGSVYMGFTADDAVGINPKDITDKFDSTVMKLTEQLALKKASVNNNEQKLTKV